MSEVISVSEENSQVKGMERKHLIILGILVFFICCIVFLTLGIAGHLG